MELRHLRYFIAVAEELHFGRAAQRLRITQPPLSSQIQSLERELGVQLFIRGRTIQLTEPGRVLLEEARRAIEAADAAARAAKAAGRSHAGRLRVGYPAMTVSELVPNALRTFQQRHPDVAVEPVVAHTGAHLEALDGGELDVAFICGGTTSAELRFQALHAEPFVLAVRDDHELAGAGAGQVRLDQLAGEPIVLFPRSLEPSLYYYLLNDVLGRSRVATVVALEATTVQSTYSAVAAGLGIAFTIESTASVMAVPGVAHLPFASPPPVFRHGVAWRSGIESPVVRDFLCLLDGLARAAERPGGVGANGHGNGHGHGHGHGRGNRNGNGKGKGNGGNGLATAPALRPRPAKRGALAEVAAEAVVNGVKGVDGVDGVDGVAAIG